MSDLPGHQNVRPDPQDDLNTAECDKHGEYVYERDIRCPFCARYQVKRKAAIMGLETQMYRITKSNVCDYRDLQEDLKRALTFLRTMT